MAVKGVFLPLFDNPVYEYSVALEGVSYRLKFTYNDRCSCYFMDIKDADNNPLVLGVGLVPTYPICTDYRIQGLTGFFWLQQKSDAISEPYKSYPENLSQYYDFYYTYTTED